MNIIHIFGIAILLGAYSLNGDTKTDKSQQRILLRKLQNFQETKPLTWNEVLADVLVNKIGIFSFTSQDKEDMIKDNAPISRERNFLTDFFSKAIFAYKKFIYDAFVGKRKENDDKLQVNTIPFDPKSIELENRIIDPEVVIRPTEVTFAKGPKSEVELVEPKYHGKITFEGPSTENPGEINVDPSEKDDTGLKVKTTDPQEQNSDDHQANPVKEETVNDCTEGFIKSENGDCLNNNARLMLAIPNQCPLGYRKDWLGNCRKVFKF